MSTNMKRVEEISTEVKKSLENKEIAGALLATTFQGLSVQQMAMALREGMIAGFTFDDFIKKDVYAVPYGNKYSLVTSIDYSRKIAMKNGLAGKTAPIYTYKNADKSIIESCTITVKRSVSGVIGDYTATVFFDEYYAGHKNPDGSIKRNSYGEMKPNLWDTKPHTMIAKVAEMHALRMAFPEDLSKQYVEEEFMKPEAVIVVVDVAEDAREKAIALLTEATTKEELSDVWVSLLQKERDDPTIKAKFSELRSRFEAAEKAIEEPVVEVGTQPSSVKKRTAKKKVEKKEDDGSVDEDQLPPDLK